MMPVSEENVQNRFEAMLRLRPSQESTAEAIKRVRLAIQNQTTQKSTLWSFLMRNRPTQMAAAAAILIGIYIGFFGPGQSGIVWADVAQNVEEAKTVQFRIFASMTGMPDAEIRVYDSSEYGSRMDLYVDGKNTVKIYGPEGTNETVMVTPDGQVLSRTTFTDDQRQQMIQRQKDPREFVKLFLAENPKNLGRRTVDGIRTEGLEVTSPKVGGGMFENATGRIWADINTQFPVWMEIEGFSGGGTVQTHIVMDQFTWDAPLNVEMFEPNIPVTAEPVIKMKMADIDEKSLIKGLRFFAEQSGGAYPDSLAPMTINAQFQQIRRDKHDNQSLTVEEQTKLSFLTAAGQFYQRLVEKDCAVQYHGDTVTASDADKELLKWKISDDEFRVIYGDLHIDTVADKSKLLETALALSGKKIEQDERGPVMRMLSLSDKDLIRGLRGWLELLEGRYPDSLETKTALQQASPLLGKKYGLPDQPDKEKQKLLKSKTYDIFFASAFYEKLVRENKEPVYYGDKITVADSDRILLRWKISSKNYRVIFGNLDSKSITAQELAELEKQLPK